MENKLISRVGEAVVWTVSTEDELHRAILAEPDMIRLNGMVKCLGYPIILGNIRICGVTSESGLAFCFSSDFKAENLLCLGSDVWLRDMTIQAKAENGVFPSRDRMCAAVRVNERGCCLSDVQVKVDMRQFSGNENSQFSALYALEPLQLGGKITLDLAGKYVTAMAGSGIVRSCYLNHPLLPDPIVVTIKLKDSLLRPIYDCHLNLGAHTMRITESKTVVETVSLPKRWMCSLRDWWKKLFC